MKSIRDTIQKEIINFEKPKRKAISKKFPLFNKPIIFLHILKRKLENFLNPKIKKTRSKKFFKAIITRHQSLLMRKL